MDKNLSKRIDNFFEEKITFTNMYMAYERASRGKHENKEVILFEMDLASNLCQLVDDVRLDRYKVGIYRKFTIFEPKERMILSLPFRDRVMQQWYVEEFIKKIFMPKFIKDTYACIKGRGLHGAVNALYKYMNCFYKINKEFYILKCDISKFFNSIDKTILFQIISRKVKDKKFLNCTYKILFDGTYKIGIPIGNYTSQFFANIYLNELDHFVKEKLQIKYYVRYMDDFILLVNDKNQAIEIKKKLEDFLQNKLHLKLNKKTNYFKCTQGVSFLRLPYLFK
jgi:retron-type reverse transcriptase